MMPERDPIDRLDDLVQAMLTGAGGAGPDARAGGAGPNAELAGLLEVAAELRGMPNDDFRERLADEIALAAARGPRGANMTTTSVPEIRAGIQTIIPYLRIERVADLLEFVKQAFGAVETMRAVGSAGGLRAEARLGDSRVMMGGFQGMRSTPTAHLYVEDADSIYARALEAGATTLHVPVDQPYGDREASVKDPFGNHWYIATHTAGPAGAHRPAELRAVTPYLHLRGAGRLIDFLTEAFGAEERDRHESPDGVIHHTTVRLGDSAIEMGEAHGEWQPMPAAIYVYVEDVDALYQRALRAGAVPVEPPRDQPYGDRTAHVEDPHGNTWYLAQPIPPR